MPETRSRDEGRAARLGAAGRRRADGLAIKKLLDADGHLLPRAARRRRPSARQSAAASARVVIAEEALVADARAADRVHPRTGSLVGPAGHRAVPRRPRIDGLGGIVPQLGNVSVIERPVRMSTLVSLIRSSLRARSRQYQVREHLAQQASAQRTIREAEQRFRLLVENITDYAIFMLDAEGRVTSWNSGAQQLLGYSTDEILGQPRRRSSPTTGRHARARNERSARDGPRDEHRLARAQGCGARCSSRAC